jgi:hypothetical protein
MLVAAAPEETMRYSVLAFTISVAASVGAALPAIAQLPDCHAVGGRHIVGKVVGEPLREAQELFQSQKYAEARIRLADVQKIPDKTPFEACVTDTLVRAVDWKVAHQGK